MRKSLLLLLVFFFSGFTGTGLYAQLQGQALVDSLLKELPEAKEDTNKVKLLYHLSGEYVSVNPEEALKYAQQCLQLSNKIAWKKGIASANHTLGLCYRNKGDFRRELEHYVIAFKLDSAIGNKSGQSRDLLGIGNAYGSLCIFPQALSYYAQAVKLNEETGNKKAQASTYVSIGNVYLVQSNYPRALDYYFRSLAISEEMGSKAGSARTNFSIGNVYFALRDFQNALGYYFKALDQYKALGNKYGIAISAQGIGNVYNVQEDHAKALEYETQALKVATEVGSSYVIIACVGNLGSIYNKLRNYPLALAYSKKALEMAGESGDRHQVAWGLSEIGHVYLSVAESMIRPRPADTLPVIATSGIYPPDHSIPKAKAENLQLAISYMKQGLDSAIKYEAPDVIQPCYEGLSLAYELQGDFRSAKEYSDKFVRIKDSIFTNEHSDQMARISMSYIYSKERAIDSVATADARKAASMKLERQRRYTWIGAAGALLLSGLLFQMRRNNKLLSKEKQKSEELLLNILPSEVADELKTTGSTVARHFDNVTVLFTDFVNFTNAGEMMNPQELIDELHTCFKVFDEITVRYGIEKIKTIGDAYLAVAGLPVKDEKHAENIVNAAIAIRDFMEKRYADIGDKTFRIRIGIHSGSVVAGIVGVKKFAYDIWGDTVNTAARMEQNSEPGKINISQTTYELVKNQFGFEDRGEIDAKNKGKLKMYFAS